MSRSRLWAIVATALGGKRRHPRDRDRHLAGGGNVDDIGRPAARRAADRLVSACNGVPDVEVIWFSRYGAGGGLHMDLEAVEQMTSAPADAIDILVEQSPSCCMPTSRVLDGTGRR
jgi:hypothetical protein